MAERRCYAEAMESEAPEIDIGFNLDDAISRIHAAALEAGAVPPDDGRAKDPAHTAEAHLHSVDPGGRCSRSPCRVAGLGLALHEMTQFRAELETLAPFRLAAVSTHELLGAFRAVGADYLTGLLEHGKAAHRFEGQIDASVATHDHDLLCIRPVRILLKLADVFKELKEFDGKLREVFWSAELQQPGGKKRGARLLTAVCQHLYWGGVSYKEIHELAHGQSGNNGVADKIRMRVGSPDARSLFPRDHLVERDLPRATRSPAAKKRVRRGSSS